MDFQIVLDQIQLLGGSGSQPEIVDGLGVDGEVAHSGPVLRSHVANSGSICESERLDSVSIELYELADDSSLPQHLSAGEYQVGGGGERGQRASHFEADNFGQDHGDVLAHHDCLGLDAAHSPT